MCSNRTSKDVFSRIHTSSTSLQSHVWSRYTERERIFIFSLIGIFIQFHPNVNAFELNINYVRILFKKSIDYFDTTFYFIPCSMLFYEYLLYRRWRIWWNIMGYLFSIYREKRISSSSWIPTSSSYYIYIYIYSVLCMSSSYMTIQAMHAMVYTTLLVSFTTTIEILLYLVGKFNEKFIIIIFSILKIMIL